jgi:hypothetical protein
MRIEIKTTKADGIIQITTLDERWYAKEIETTKDVDGAIYPEPVKRTVFNPSITWIDKYSPMGMGLLKFYANKGWDEAEVVKKEAAERGSKVHQACETLIHGGQVTFETAFNNPDDPNNEKLNEPLTPDEYWYVMTFAAWWAVFSAEHEVKVIDTEKTVWVDALPGERYGYAGTRDLKLVVDGRPTVIDLKTSKQIYLGHELQLSALKHADSEDPDIFILQIGYAMNQRGYKLTQIEDKFPLFLAAKKFWDDANPEAKPKQKDYPPVIKLAFHESQKEKITEAIAKNPPVQPIHKISKRPAKGAKVVKQKRKANA